MTVDPLQQPTATAIRRRGVLTLVSGELQRYDHDPELVLQSTTAMRNKRKRRHATPPETVATTSRRQVEEYNPLHSEWTLFFVGASDNLNAIRFRPTLVDFCNSHLDKVQCICVPNMDDDALLLYGTGFYSLPFAHSNRSALLQLLGVTQVPCVVVVSNKDGRRITDQGMAAIESNGDENAALLFERWRKRESGLSMVQWTTNSCSIS
jgi:hypothetical protein